MKKGLFLKNWEVAAVFDIMNMVKEMELLEFFKEENEAFRKLETHIETVTEQWNKLSEEEQAKFMEE
jgi:hypothetical protein